jgi:hypothetical protein
VEGVHDTNAETAKFTVRGTNRTSDFCSKFPVSRAKFAELSAQLAQHLYTIAEHDERVSDATLAVLRCRAKDESAATRRLVALLKLDPSDGFHPVAKPTRRAAKLGSAQPRPQRVPDPRCERPQKCAFLTAVDADRVRDACRRQAAPCRGGVQVLDDGLPRRRSRYRLRPWVRGLGRVLGSPR